MTKDCRFLTCVLSSKAKGAAMSTILVTGGSGFIGSHCILQLLAAGHRVRTTVRSLKREEDVRAMLKEGGAAPGDRVSVVAADLAHDAGWEEAAAGCDYVLHVALGLSA
jgi:nucleoside-diphosphate-sugar epimerase